MKEGFEFISFTNSSYGGIKKKKEKVDSGMPRSFFNPPDCLVFVKDSVFCAGKFKGNPINYLFPFFPDYIDYMLQAAPYFFIHEGYLEKLEKYQPIYDISSAFDFLQEKNMVEINKIEKTITFKPLKDFEDENGMLILPKDKVKIEKTNHTFSKEAKKSNQRQYAVAVDKKLNENYEMKYLANTLGYCTKGELKQDYVPAPRPLTYNGVEYDFRTEK